MTHALGIHHVTAIAGDPQRNLDFYAGVLGLRLVKRTVNFDDPQTYHFYYGDEVGTPGSLLTFFPWPGARRGRPGPGQVAVLSFAAPPGAMGFWLERLIAHGVEHEGAAPLDPEGVRPGRVLSFRDPDGLLLEIVGHPDAERVPSWEGAPGIPPGHGLHGFHRVTLWAEDAAPTASVLTELLGFRAVHTTDHVTTYEIGGGGSGKTVLVRETGGFPKGLEGAGTVHHIAWRVSDDPTELELRERLIDAGLVPTPVIDRQYFHSVYFREPGDILFELATDGPGFAVDEPTAHLGEHLKLPPRLEPMRSRIEAVLPPIHLPAERSTAADSAFLEDPAGRGGATLPELGFTHRYVAGAGATAGVTLLLLHGTGGDESDLLGLGASLAPGTGILSPRGKVLENGAPRFFARLAPGVFDQDDLRLRTRELARFVEAATEHYGLDPRRWVAVGFSNGANIAASMLLRYPDALAGAVLLHPSVPFVPEILPDLGGVPVFIAAGRTDPVAAPAEAEELAMLLRTARAEVTLHWSPGGHQVTPESLDAARAWFASEVTTHIDEEGPHGQSDDS